MKHTNTCHKGMFCTDVKDQEIMIIVHGVFLFLFYFFLLSFLVLHRHNGPLSALSTFPSYSKRNSS